jgi:hypothetical protein
MINEYEAVGGMGIVGKGKITQRKIKCSHKLLELLVGPYIFDIIHPLGFISDTFRKLFLSPSSKPNLIGWNKPASITDIRPIDRDYHIAMYTLN